MKFHLFGVLCFLAVVAYGQETLESCRERFISPLPNSQVERAFDGKGNNKDVEGLPSNIGGSVNSFGFNLFKKVQFKGDKIDWKKNVVASPLSVSLAFSLIYDGATPDSETKREIGSALFYESDACHGLLLRESVNGLTGEGVNELAIASKIFIDDDAEPRAYFTNRQSVEIVDFADSGEAAQTINEFVDESTKGLITDVVDESSIDQSTIMSIVNALFFKGQWASKFDPSRTEIDTFTLGDGTTKKVPFMQQDGDFKFARTASGAYLEMPYIGDRFVMNLFKPTDPKEMANFIKGLSFASFTKTMASARKSEVMVRLPKFEIEASYNLHEILPSFGMKKVFTQAAELDQISSQGAFVGSAIHKAKIIINEEGTEAASVTETRVQPLSAPPSFIADEPFVYFITDTYNGNIVLFMGSVMDP